jgi:hypothetical protein
METHLKLLEVMMMVVVSMMILDTYAVRKLSKMLALTAVTPETCFRS